METLNSLCLGVKGCCFPFFVDLLTILQSLCSAFPNNNTTTHRNWFGSDNYIRVCVINLIQTPSDLYCLDSDYDICSRANEVDKAYFEIYTL